MALYDPEFYTAAVEPMIKSREGEPTPPPAANAFEMRTQINAVFATIFAEPIPDSIVQTTVAVKTPGGGTVSVTRFATAAQTTQTTQVTQASQPAIVYMHPGGMVGGSVEIMAGVIAQSALLSGVQHWAVDYAKSPEAVAPVALEQCYAVLVHLSTHAAALGIDPARIAVAGASAGGALAAGVALMARDRALQPPLAKIILVYPMLDDRTVQVHPPPGCRHAGANTHDDDWPLRPYLIWTTEANATAWAAYLGVGNPKADSACDAAAALALAGESPAAASPYAVPARATSLAGLPSVYMDVGGLDLFLEECTRFAARLTRDGVDLDFHVFRGVPHGFESPPTTKVAQSSSELRIRAMQSF